MAQTNGSAFTPPGADWTVPLWLNGEQVNGSKTFDIISPLTDTTLYKSAAASKEDALAAVAAAEKTFPAWSKTKPGQRRDLLLKAAEELVRRKSDLWYFCSQVGGFECFTSGLVSLWFLDVYRRLDRLVCCCQFYMR